MEADIKKLLDEIKPMFVPPSGTLELVSLKDKELKLKVTGLPEDVFKVQGKIINYDEEIKSKIIGKISSVYPDLQISFI